ncbi:MAG: hypothetical protein ABJG41_17435 [Cyclobacteriaceae bacterium]
MKYPLSFILLIVVYCSTYSQPPGGGRPGRFDPAEMVKREQQNVKTKVSDLSEDQMILIDGIYEEYAVTITETMEEGRNGEKREDVRAKMRKLRDEKSELIRDVLNDTQYAEYEKIIAEGRRRPNQPKDSEEETSN